MDTNSISQWFLRDEIHQALNAEVKDKEKIVELEHVIVNPDLQKSSDHQIAKPDLIDSGRRDFQIVKSMPNASEYKSNVS